METTLIESEDEAIDLIERVAVATPLREGQDPNDIAERVEQLAQVFGAVIMRLYGRLTPMLQLRMMEALLNSLGEGVTASMEMTAKAERPLTDEQMWEAHLNADKSRAVH